MNRPVLGQNTRIESHRPHAPVESRSSRNAPPPLGPDHHGGVDCRQGRHVPRRGYSASKHGVLGLMRSLALEVCKEGITVNAICPGPVKTVMNDLRIEYDAKRLGRRTGRIRETADADRRTSGAGGYFPAGRLSRQRFGPHGDGSGVQRLRRVA